MSGFEKRWHTLARAAGKAGSAPSRAPDRRQVESWMVLGRSEAVRQARTPARLLPGWVLPAAALVLLYALALPVSGRAWTNTLTLENPLSLVPRPPVVPSPPVPSPPSVPRLPLRGSTDWLDSLMKEMHP
jgi:hypothetical protein